LAAEHPRGDIGDSIDAGIFQLDQLPYPGVRKKRGARLSKAKSKPPARFDRRDAPAARTIRADGAALAADRDHARENLVCMDRRVVAEHGIPPRDELPAAAVAAEIAEINDAMRHQQNGATVGVCHFACSPWIS